MPTLYSVIKFLPNTISDESVNVGLLVIDGQKVQVRPLAEWDRLKGFVGRDWKNVRRFMGDLKGDPTSILGIAATDSAPDLNAKLSGWQRSIRFSEVRGSLEDSASLLHSLPSIFLHETSHGRLDGSGRRKMIVDNLYSAVASAYAIRFDRKPSGLLHRDARAAGKRTTHKIDVGIVNGYLYAGAFAISFANTQENRQWRDTDAIAFALEDIERVNDTTTIAVLMDEPEKTHASDRARNLFNGLGARLLGVDGIQGWAQEAVMRVPDSVAASG